MIKKIFILIYFLVVAPSAFAATQYYYLKSTGAGSNSGDTGTWSAVPTTATNAMSASNFNDPGNWSASESASKIDPDDVVYPKGTWDSEAYNLTPVMGITLDFLENGTYDPVTGSKTIEPVFKNTRINIRTNNVKIYDGRFGYQAGDKYRCAPYTIHAAPVSPNAMKITGLEVKRNAFYGDYYADSPSVYLGFVCDSEVSGNYFESFHSNWDACAGHSRFLAIHAGSRNKITDNHINGGFTAIIFWHKKDWNLDGLWDIPSSGSYAVDPDGNLEDNEIAGNYIVNRCEEGISYDTGGGAPDITIVERDTVDSINGNQIILANSRWSNAGNKYSGFYMVSVDDEDNSFGRHALIQTHSKNVFTFSKNISELFPGLGNGEYVIISLVFRHNWIHKNIFPASSGYVGFASDSILFEGVTLENMVEDNFMGKLVYTPGHGIKIRPLHACAKSTGSITQTYASGASAFNVIRKNTCYGIVELVYSKEQEHSWATPWPYIDRNNAYYDNVLYSGVDLNSCHVYEKNNGVVKKADNVKILQSDPTAHVSQYFANWASKQKISSIAPPGGVTVQILK